MHTEHTQVAAKTIVFLHSSSCAFMTSTNEPERTAGAARYSEADAALELPVGWEHNGAPAEQQEPRKRAGRRAGTQKMRSLWLADPA